MIARGITFLAATIIGVALGIGSALYLSGLWPGVKPLSFGDVNVDGWRSDFAIGSKSADPYTRARIARHGLFALAKSEAIYFTRNTDEAGRLLRENCRYLLKGGNFPASWWSITLYDARSKLADNRDEAASIDKTSISQSEFENGAARAGAERPAVQHWQALIARKAPPASSPFADDPFISSRNAGQFDLTLRLYLPTPALLASPQAALNAPRITRLDCEDASTGAQGRS